MPDLSNVLQWLVPPGAFITVLTFAISAYRKRRSGQLTRAAATTKELAKVTRLYDYIYQLRADFIAQGKTPRNWPRGLKPKE